MKLFGFKLTEKSVHLLLLVVSTDHQINLKTILLITSVSHCLRLTLALTRSCLLTLILIFQLEGEMQIRLRNDCSRELSYWASRSQASDWISNTRHGTLWISHRLVLYQCSTKNYRVRRYRSWFERSFFSLLRNEERSLSSSTKKDSISLVSTIEIPLYLNSAKYLGMWL